MNREARPITIGKQPFGAELYFADVSNLNVDEEIKSLPLERQTLAKSYLREKDRKLSIGAWLVLKEALKRHDINTGDYTIGKESKGKPFLEGCPYCFSLSHSGNYVLVAISLKPVGCDIQEIRKTSDCVIKEVLNESDKAFLSKCDDKEKGFFKIWVLKEAEAKRTGEGLSAGLKNIKVDYMEIEARTFEIIPGYQIGISFDGECQLTPIEIRL